MLRKLGSAKYKLIRVFAYIQLVNLAILIQVNGLHLWYLVVPPIFIVLYWFEVKHGIPGEQDVGWANSSEWQTFKVSNALHQAYVKYTFGQIRDELARLQKRPKTSKNDYRETTLTIDDLKKRGKKQRTENE